MLTVALSLLVGIAVGMLGGGGSILTIPILTYVAGFAPKQAIAASLFIVGMTSAAAVVPHALARNVEWRRGLSFGLAGMIGAFVGGRASSYLPGDLLLSGFALLMLVAATAMLRKREADRPAACEAGSSEPLLRMAVRGFSVGALTGVFGAGGGFLIVPALVVLGAMPMRRAVATSLLVITLQAFAGFAGHVHALSFDWSYVLTLTAASVTGSVFGVFMAHKVSGPGLRTAFGWLVASMAVVILAREVHTQLSAAAWYHAMFLARWPWWVAGAAIASVVLGLLWTENKQLGVSTGVSELCMVPRDTTKLGSWRITFLLGILLGGGVAGLLGGTSATLAMGQLDAIVGGSMLAKLSLLTLAGVLIGAGTRLAGGCTSGHGIVGTALGARSSWIATAAFMAAGFVTTQLIHLIVGA